MEHDPYKDIDEYFVDDWALQNVESSKSAHNLYMVIFVLSIESTDGNIMLLQNLCQYG